MLGVSEVIAIILILMITISLAGLAYMFMSTTMSDVTASAGSTVDTTTSSMLTSFTIESMDVAKVYVRNTGQNTLTSLSVYVNDEPATYNVTTPIAPGTVGTATIYSFIPDGATVKVTSPSGFSASKVARPCEKAVGCWKFDDGSGTTAYDSSLNGNTGTLVNGTGWTTGQHGSALLFDGTNDYLNITDSQSINITGNAITISFLLNWRAYTSYDRFISKEASGYLGYTVYGRDTGGMTFRMNLATSGDTYIHYYTPIGFNQWHYVAATYNSTRMMLYLDGSLIGSAAASGNLQSSGQPLRIGGTTGYFFNGTIDEVRIYNRAIY